jgi:hypothetical protein
MWAKARTRLRSGAIGLLVSWGIWIPVAQAEPHQMCLYLDIGADYWDASPRAADGEDFREEFGRNEGYTSFPAQRWLARVRDEAAGEIVFGWRPLDGNGCAAFEIAGGPTELTIEWMRWAVWDREVETGNQLVGYRCDAVMANCTLRPSTRTVPADMLTGVTEVVVEPFSVGTGVEQIDLAFWAATFAEERFAAMGEQPLVDTSIYVGYDPQDILPGQTQADRTFGNQPSVVIAGESWRSKFTVAHELGHQQTLAAAHPSFGRADFDYCYDPTMYPVTAAGCTPNHTLTSHEWQAAAAMEGIAHWYSVSVWNDVDLVECGSCQSGVRYVSPTGPDMAQDFAVPRQTPLCTAFNEPQCPPGVGNEWDWVSAFRLFRLDAPTPPSFRTMFTMLSAFYATGSWNPNLPSDAFWTGLDQTMAGHLGANHAAWQAAAMQMELDR